MSEAQKNTSSNWTPSPSSAVVQAREKIWNLAIDYANASGYEAGLIWLDAQKAWSALLASVVQPYEEQLAELRMQLMERTGATEADAVSVSVPAPQLSHDGDSK